MDFTCNPKNACDENAFVDNWPNYGTKLRTLVKSDVSTDWDQDIENLLLLLYVFPSKSTKLPFVDAIKKLIVFRVVSDSCIPFVYSILTIGVFLFIAGWNTTSQHDRKSQQTSVYRRLWDIAKRNYFILH